MAIYTDIFDGPLVSILMALLALLVFLAIWSSVTRLRPDEILPQIPGHGVRNLFLRMRFRDAVGAKEKSEGYLMSLSLRKATFVTSKRVQRGDHLRLDLDSLPGFPESGPDAIMEANVRASRKLGGDPETYLVTVRLVAKTVEAREPLSAYIHQLSGTSRTDHLSPA